MFSLFVLVFSYPNKLFWSNNKELSNLVLCSFRVLESPFECIDTATYGFYDYFGFNVTYACRGSEDTIDGVKAKWQTMIDPFCGADLPANHVSQAKRYWAVQMIAML